MKSSSCQQKKAYRPCAIPIALDPLNMLFVGILLIVVLGYAIWFSWTFFQQAILSGELLRRYHEFQQNHLHNQMSIILTPLGFIIPLVLAGLIVYLLIIIAKPFLRKTQYYMVFTKNGIDVGGFFYSWDSIVWFGAKKAIFGRGVIPCWATPGIKHGKVRLHMPSIKPIPQEIFNKLRNEIHKRFSEKIKNMDSSSWNTVWFDNDFPYQFHTETIIPWQEKNIANCDIIG